MATTLHLAVAGPIHSTERPDNFDKSFDLAIRQRQNIPIKGSQFFREETADSEVWKMTTWSNVLNMPRISNDTAPLPFTAPSKGYPLSVTIKTYRQALALTRTFIKVDRFKSVGSMQEGLLDMGKRHTEMGFANVINTGTTTNGSDGTTLFANDHKNVDPRGGTWSNVGAAGAALSETTFGAARLILRKTTNDKGQISPVMVNQLIIPADLESHAIKVTKSEREPGTALNAVNPWEGQAYFVWDYLTSTTAWYLWGDSPRENWGLHYCILTKPEVNALPFPSAQYPDVVKGWYYYSQIEWAGSTLRNMLRDAGA